MPKFLQGLVGQKQGDPQASKRVSHEPLMDIDSLTRGSASSGNSNSRPSQDEELPSVANLDVCSFLELVVAESSLRFSAAGFQ